MRLQPGITQVLPADYRQAATALLATWDLPGPVYYRLSKDDNSVIPTLNGRFDLGRSHMIGAGTDALIITMGSIAREAVLAVDELSAQGISVSVLLVSSLNPSPLEDIVMALSLSEHIITFEEHYITGGLGSLEAEIIADRGIARKIVRCGVTKMPTGITGSPDYMHRINGIDHQSLVATVKKVLQ
jgi:transketolase